MKKTNYLLLVFTLLLALSACGTLRALDAKSFSDKMKEESYTIVDGLTQMNPAAKEKIKTSTIAISSDKSHQIEFYELLSDDIAVQMFNANKDLFEKEKTKESKIEASEKDHEYYKHTTKGRTYLISKIGSTILYANVEDQYSSELDKRVKKLGYK